MELIESVTPGYRKNNTMGSHQPENALGLDLKQASPSASVDNNSAAATTDEASKQSKSATPKQKTEKKDSKGKGKEGKTTAEASEKAPISPGANPAVPVSPTTASAADGEDKDAATDKSDLSRPVKTKPYVNPDRVQTGGSQRASIVHCILGPELDPYTTSVCRTSLVLRNLRSAWLA